MALSERQMRLKHNYYFDHTRSVKDAGVALQRKNVPLIARDLIQQHVHDDKMHKILTERPAGYQHDDSDLSKTLAIRLEHPEMITDEFVRKLESDDIQVMRCLIFGNVWRLTLDHILGKRFTSIIDDVHYVFALTLFGNMHRFEYTVRFPDLKVYHIVITFMQNPNMPLDFPYKMFNKYLLKENVFTTQLLPLVEFEDNLTSIRTDMITEGFQTEQVVLPVASDTQKAQQIRIWRETLIMVTAEYPTTEGGTGSNVINLIKDHVALIV